MLDKKGIDNYSYNADNINFISGFSETIGKYIGDEYKRQQNNIELIASENYCSDAVLACCGSCLSWKYAEGYPDQRETGNCGRYYGGTEHVDKLEEYCCSLWKKVFDTDYHVNVQPHSGSSANFSAFRALMPKGGKVLAMSLDNGGHLTHGSSVNFSGNTYEFIFYDVDSEGRIDMEDVRRKAKEERPDLILAGGSAYARVLDFERFADIAKENNALFMVDMAHIAGLIAAGEHPSPFGLADIVTTTTHKTLRGPRGGMIFGKKELAKKIDSSVFPYAQGGPLMHIIAGKAMCAEEALRDDFKVYIKQVVKNSKAFAEQFTALGYKVVTGGTDNHLFLVDLSDLPFSGKDLQDRLDLCGITLNKNCIPNDKRSPKETSGIRVGTAPMTTRGYMEDDFRNVALKIHDIICKMKEEYK